MREERRIVTALFADIVGSTGLAERLDPEDAREIVGGAIALIVQQIDSFGGTVKDLAGDGVLALFGAPTAHEDDAERAVQCGLRITAALAEYAGDVSRRWGVDDFSVRVGIETGRAVTGPVGGGSRVEYGATGDALNTAARLLANTDPGRVLVGEKTQAMVRARFAFDESRTYELKGKERSVRAAVVLGRAPQQGMPVAFGDAQLVGRSQELRALEDALARLTTGKGAVVTIVGQPGLGKSRLVREAFERAAGSGVRWLDAGAASYEASIPYLLFRKLLLRWIGLGLEASPLQIQEAFEASVLGLPAGSRVEQARLMPILTGGDEEANDPELNQERVFRSVVGLVDALVLQGPTAVVLEDLHWADPTSVALTELLVDLVGHRPLLLLVTTRPTSRALEALERVESRFPDQAWRLDLAPLTREEDKDLVRQLLGDGRLPYWLEERLLDTTDGNPFFVGEQLRALFAEGTLERSGRSVRLAAGATGVLAPTIERALLSRIDCLPDQERRTLLAASVLGAQFDIELISAVAGADAGQSIGRLEQASFITRVTTRDEGTSVYSFCHALMQEAAYASILRRQKRQLHRRAAESLQIRFVGRENEVAATLGRHLAQGGEPARAIRYLASAAKAAAATFANEEAAALARDGLALVADKGVLPAAQDATVAAELSRIEGSALRSLARYEEAIAAFRSALSWTSVGDTIGQARLRSTIGQVLADAHRYEEALVELDVASGLVTVSSGANEAFVAWLDILLAKGSTLYWLGERERYWSLLQGARPVVEQHGTSAQRIEFYSTLRNALLLRERYLISEELAQLDQWLYDAKQESPDDEVRAWAAFTHGFVMMLRRDLGTAEALFAACLAVAEKRGLALLRSRAVTYRMVCARFAGDPDTAEHLLEPVRLAARAAELPEYEAMAAATEAWIALRRGDGATVVRSNATSALESWAALPNRYPMDWMACLPLLALSIDEGNPAEAQIWAQRMLEDSQLRLPSELEASLSTGLERARAGSTADAVQAFKHGLNLSERMGYL